MKQGVCIVWVFLIALQTGYQGIVCTYYALQKEYLTKQYCKNKDKPALKCRGKCHLRTLMAVQEDEPDQNTKQSSTLKEITPQPLIGLLPPFPYHPSSRGCYSDPYLRSLIAERAVHYQYLLATDILHPPELFRLSTLS